MHDPIGFPKSAVIALLERTRVCAAVFDSANAQAYCGELSTCETSANLPPSDSKVSRQPGVVFPVDIAFKTRIPLTTGMVFSP